jgi:hypothetical protein
VVLAAVRGIKVRFSVRLPLYKYPPVEKAAFLCVPSIAGKSSLNARVWEKSGQVTNKRKTVVGIMSITRHEGFFINKPRGPIV